MAYRTRYLFQVQVAVFGLILGCWSSSLLAQDSHDAQEAHDTHVAPEALSEFQGRAGAFSLDAGFPGGGSIVGTNSLGGRYFITDNVALGAYIQFSYEEARKFSAVGGTARLAYVALEKLRSHLYVFMQGSVGKNIKNHDTAGTDSTDTGGGESQMTDLQAGASGGIGIEIFLIPELSTSVEIGIGGNFLPATKNTLSTGMGQLGVHYFLGK